MTRRARGDGGLHWDEHRQRWIATTTIGYDGRGKRVLRKASGSTRTEAKNKLRDLLRDQAVVIKHDTFHVSIRRATTRIMGGNVRQQSPSRAVECREAGCRPREAGLL